MSAASKPPPSLKLCHYFYKSCATTCTFPMWQANFISLHVGLFNVNITYGRNVITIATNVDKAESEGCHTDTQIGSVHLQYIIHSGRLDSVRICKKNKKKTDLD